MKKLRYLFGIILILVAVFIIYPKFKNSISELPGLLHNANKFLIFLLVFFQFTTYLADALMSKILLKIAGHNVKLKNTLRISVVDTLANLTLPVIGSPMIKYYFYKKLKVSSSAILFLITAWTLLFYFTAIAAFVISVIFHPERIVNYPKYRFVFIGFTRRLFIFFSQKRIQIIFQIF